MKADLDRIHKSYVLSSTIMQRTLFPHNRHPVSDTCVNEIIEPTTQVSRINPPSRLREEIAAPWFAPDMPSKATQNHENEFRKKDDAYQFLYIFEGLKQKLKRLYLSMYDWLGKVISAQAGYEEGKNEYLRALYVAHFE